MSPCQRAGLAMEGRSRPRDPTLACRASDRCRSGATGVSREETLELSYQAAAPRLSSSPLVLVRFAVAFGVVKLCEGEADGVAQRGVDVRITDSRANGFEDVVSGQVDQRSQVQRDSSAGSWSHLSTGRCERVAQHFWLAQQPEHDGLTFDLAKLTEKPEELRLSSESLAAGGSDVGEEPEQQSSKRVVVEEIELRGL